MQSPEVLDFAPERLVDPIPRRPLLARIGTVVGDGFVSLLLNAGVIGWLASVGWPLRSAEAPQPLSVEIVDHIPGQDHGAKPGGQASSQGTDAANPGDNHPTGPSSQAEHADADAHQPAEKPPAPPEKPSTAPADKPPEEPPATAAADTAAPQPDTPPAATPPADPASKPPEALPHPAQPPAPPPEHGDATATGAPELVAIPVAPAPTPGAGAAADTPAPPQPAGAAAAPSPPPRPEVLSSRDAPDDVAPAAPPPPETPPEPTAEQKRQAEATAKLAAALPFATGGIRDPMAGRLASPGEQASQSYRGAVYGNFSKGNDLVEDARAKHLKGKAVIAFSIDGSGNLASIAVALSSGNPQIDQTALEMIRRAAPFPAPPPGAQRNFSPTIVFGADE